MSKPADIEAFLSTVSRKLESGDVPSLEDLKTIVSMCNSMHSQIREAALTLLLQPPLKDDIEYYRWLIPTILGNFPIKKLPLPFLELICEVISFLERIPADQTLSEAFVRFLKHLPAPALKALYSRRYPLHPFLSHLSAKTVARFGNSPPPYWKILWRQFRWKILRGPTEPSWAHLTFSDLSGLWLGPHPSGRRYRLSKARWRRVMCHLRVPAATDLTPCFNSADIFKSSRRGRGHAAHPERGWENLVDVLSEELEAVRKLTLSVSKTTRRVVLSWHNATLAAPGGWAFESIGQQIPSRRDVDKLQNSVGQQAKVLHERVAHSWDELDDIWELWQNRLVEPKILHALWESRIKREFGSISQVKWDEDLATSRNLLGTATLSALNSKDIFSWHGAVSSHQRIRLEEIVAWRNFRHKIWFQGLITLAALMREVQSMLDRGLISYFVLPWIDKFFISSKREADLEYLAAIVKWLESWGAQPLVLFWEDTGRAQTPSFQLALNRLRESGMKFRGIGIFDSAVSRRKEAFDIINSEHMDTRLFALRPYSDTHSPKSLTEILHNPTRSSLLSHDSSWKDNLCFIYAGTQIQHLLSVQCEEERFPSWIQVGNFKYPFGVYFRERVRHRLLSHISPMDIEDSFSHAYSIWANLC